MTVHHRHQSLFWLLAGWLFIAPFLGFQHFYSVHSPLASDVCETCLLSTNGGHAITPHITTMPVAAPLQYRITSTALPSKHSFVYQASARAPPIV